MSRIRAFLQPSDQRLDDIAARLRAHPWVSDARADDARENVDADPACGRLIAFVMPSADGVRALRTSGKDRLAREFRRWVREGAAAECPELDLRLVESLAAGDAGTTAGESRCPWMPIVADVAPDERGLSCTLRVPYDLPIFHGHFPDRPIVPGVMQVGWAVTLSREHGLAEGPLHGIPATKFSRIVRPGAVLTARFARGSKAGQVQFQYSSRDTTVATGRLQFGAARD